MSFTSPDIPDKPIPPTAPTEPARPIEPRPMTSGTEKVPEFTLPPTAAPGGGAVKPAAEGQKPSPMEVAAETARGGEKATQQSVQDRMAELNVKLDKAKSELNNPERYKNLTEEHVQALNKLVTKLNSDIRGLAKNAGTDFMPPRQMKGGKAGLREFLINWIDGGQQAINEAMVNVKNMKDPDPAVMMQAQIMSQRASERIELFSNIIGATVSGVKTIMSTQLG